MAPTVTTSRPASWPGPPLRQLEVRSPRPGPSDRLLPLVSKRLWPARRTLVSSKCEPTLPLLSACVPSPPGELVAFAVTTANGILIEGDIWFRTYGVQPTTDYVAGDLADAIATGAYLRVTPRLTVVGHDRVYAIGDIADIDINRASV